MSFRGFGNSRHKIIKIEELELDAGSKIKLILASYRK